MLGQITQFLVEYAQALARYFVRLDVIDADLQRIKSSLVQALDAIGREVITIGNQARDDSMRTDMTNDVVKFRMHHWFAAGYGHYRGAQFGEFIDAALHHLE